MSQKHHASLYALPYVNLIKMWRLEKFTCTLSFQLLDLSLFFPRVVKKVFTPPLFFSACKFSSVYILNKTAKQQIFPLVLNVKLCVYTHAQPFFPTQTSDVWKDWTCERTEYLIWGCRVCTGQKKCDKLMTTPFFFFNVWFELNCYVTHWYNITALSTPIFIHVL